MSVIIQHLLTRMLTRLACRANVKIVVIKQYFTALKAQGKYVIADVICYWKMTSFRPLDVVTSFLCLKDVTNTCKRLRRGLSIVKYWREFFSAKAESWKKLKTSNLFSSFIVQ